MDEISIKNILLKLLKTSRVTFLGVFPSDHIPCVSDINHKTPCCYVANTDPCTEGGTHWVAFFHPRPNDLEFFDSFGKTPNYYHFPIASTMSLKHNTIQLQSDKSTLCGQWCILFHHRRSFGTSLESLVRCISSLTPTKADNLVSNYFTQVQSTLKKQ